MEKPQSSNTECIWVVGHKNPDTDAVVSAIGYAWLLRERDKLDAQPARAGQLNPQTTFALRTFDVEPPIVLADASPRFASVARAIEPLTPDRPLQDAWALVARTGRVAPVVDESRCPLGLTTPCGDATDREAPRFEVNARIAVGLAVRYAGAQIADDDSPRPRGGGATGNVGGTSRISSTGCLTLAAPMERSRCRGLCRARSSCFRPFSARCSRDGV